MTERVIPQPAAERLIAREARVQQLYVTADRIFDLPTTRYRDGRRLCGETSQGATLRGDNHRDGDSRPSVNRNGFHRAVNVEQITRRSSQCARWALLRRVHCQTSVGRSTTALVHRVILPALIQIWCLTFMTIAVLAR